MNKNEKIRIGLVGTGFIGKGYVQAVEWQDDIEIVKVLTRRKINECSSFPREDLLTNSMEELIDHSDMIMECSGDIVHATDVIAQAFTANLPVVTMDAEVHVTTGSYFAGKGILTEAEGDQPGCLAAVYEDALSMGFTPLVLGNVKGFQNLNPSLSDMEFWAKKQGLSLPMVTASTDGTKLQFEQALLANGFDTHITQTGLTGIETDHLEKSALELAQLAKQLGAPISDYIIMPNCSARVFLVVEHHVNQKANLEYFKLGKGPFYVLTHNTNLCHLEISKTVRRVRDGRGVLLNNSESPGVSVASVAKEDLKKGTSILTGCGSFELRGSAVNIKENIGHLPIGLVKNCVIKNNVEAGQILTMDDVELPESLA
ncbi:Homoserine dehydrogenase, partial [hydrothermal vent metagenome]